MAVVKMAASSRSTFSPLSVLALAPIRLLPDSRLLVIQQFLPTPAPPLHQPAPPPFSKAVTGPFSHKAPPTANPGQASRQSCSDFSVDFLLSKMAERESPADNLQARVLPLVVQQQQGRGGGGNGCPVLGGVGGCASGAPDVVWPLPQLMVI